MRHDFHAQTDGGDFMDPSEERAEERARILVLGGGFGGLFTALGLARAGDVTLVANEDHFLHTPLLYEYLSGEVEAWHIAPRYTELIGDDKVHFVQGAVTDIDFDRKEVSVAGRVRRLAYDYLVLGVGGVTNFWGIEGAEQHALPFRKIRHADDLRARMIDALDRIPPDAAPQDARRAATFVVVGGTLQVRGRPEVFALGDIAYYPHIPPSLAGTAQIAFQQAKLVARNVQELIDGGAPAAGHFEELGEAVSLGTDEAAVLTAGHVVTGEIARQARFALYTSRLPTWHHRLRVGAAWFFGGKTPRPLGLQGDIIKG